VVEHSLGKGEVAGPIPAKGTSFWGVGRWAGPDGCNRLVFRNSLKD
jgi:hypothetical protein